MEKQFHQIPFLFIFVAETWPNGDKIASFLHTEFQFHVDPPNTVKSRNMGWKCSSLKPFSDTWLPTHEVHRPRHISCRCSGLKSKTIPIDDDDFPHHKKKISL
jgi:hypothetical protein